MELLIAKGDTEELGVHWTDGFLKRHLTLKMKFVTGLDKERANAEDPAIVADWFKLFERTITTYNVHIDDIYNMDEKGCMMGVIGKCKVIVSQHKRKQYITQCGSREWVSLIECISTTSRLLPPWFIFKGKQH